MANKITWDQANFKWNDNPHIWNLVLEILEAGGGTLEGAVRAVEELEPEKKKRFIKLVCKVTDAPLAGAPKALMGLILI